PRSAGTPTNRPSPPPWRACRRARPTTDQRWPASVNGTSCCSSTRRAHTEARPAPLNVSRTAAAGGPVDRALQLRLAHLRAAADAADLGLLVELVAGPPARSLVRAQSAASARRDVRP